MLVLRLLAANTIEEHILDVAEQKRKFADSSITGRGATVPPVHGVIAGSKVLTGQKSELSGAAAMAGGWRVHEGGQTLTIPACV